MSARNRNSGSGCGSGIVEAQAGMDPFEAIRKERKTGKLFCGTTKAAKSVTALAAEFGLKADASLYHQVDAEMARAILVGILHRDLAYGNRCCRWGGPRSWPGR